MNRQEIRVSGFGGQGIIFLAYVTGRTASIHEGRHATMTQSFGPEARGSACSAQLILSDDPVDYPYIRKPSILISMSQDAYKMYHADLDPKGDLLIDEDLVTPEKNQKSRIFKIPATRIAEDMGRRICANMVMFGFFAATTGVVGKDAARQAIEASVPPGSEEMNLKAFDSGYAHGEKQIPEVGKKKPAKKKKKPATK